MHKYTFTSPITLDSQMSRSLTFSNTLLTCTDSLSLTHTHTHTHTETTRNLKSADRRDENTHATCAELVLGRLQLSLCVKPKQQPTLARTPRPLVNDLYCV